MAKPTTAASSGAKRPSPHSHPTSTSNPKTSKKHKKNGRKEDTQCLASNKSAPNRFKFQTFHDRISNISIDSFTKLSGLHGLCPDQSSGSWFLEAMEAWRELNYTAAFQQVLDSLSPFAVSLPALLFHKDAIVAVLTAAVKEGVAKKSLVKPTANLLAMLVKDLGEELYGSFPVIFESTSRALVDCADPEDIEAAFSCMVYVLKAMQERVLLDIDAICLNMFCPLFKSSKKPYLKRLACYSYSFLIHSANDTKPIMALLENAKGDRQVIECAVDCVILSIVDSESGKPRARQVFLDTANVCLSNGSATFVDAFVGKLAERMSEHECLFAVVTEHCGKIGDGALQTVFLKCRPSETVISAISARLIPNPSLLVSLMGKMNFERLLTNRSIVINVLQRMSDADFLVVFAALVDLKWTHFKVILPVVLENRRIDGKLLTVLATMHRVGFADVDWGKIRVKSGDCSSCPEAALEFDASVVVDVDAIDKLEFQVAAVSQMLRQKISVGDSILSRFIHHPAVFAAATAHPHDRLLFALCSTDERVRRGALRLLLEQSPDSKTLQTLSKIDSIPTDLDHYRDRLLAMRPLELLKEDVSEEEAAAAICFLLGAAQVKLTVLWAETFRMLSVLISKYASLFERHFSAAFEYAVSAEREGELYDLPKPLDTKDIQAVLASVTKRCSSLESLRLHLSAVILAAPTACYSMVTAEGVSVWIRMMSSHSTIADHCQPLLHTLLHMATTNDAHSRLHSVARSSLLSTLHTVSTITRTNPATRPFFEECATRFLSSGDQKVQEKALAMTLNLHKREITREFGQDFRALLEEKTSRDQLVIISTTDMAKWQSSAAWSDHLLPILCRLLYGKMIAKRKAGGSGRNSMEQRRKTILSALASWPEQARSYFVRFISASDGNDCATVDWHKKAGFLAMLEPVLEHMARSLSVESMRHLVWCVLDILEQAESSAQTDAKRLRQLACKRLVLALSKIDDGNLDVVDGELKMRVWRLAIEPRLPKFDTELVQSRSATVELLTFLADSPHLNQMIDEVVMQKVTAAIASRFVKPGVLCELMAIPLSLIRHQRHAVIDVPQLVAAVSGKTIVVDAETGAAAIVNKQVFAVGVSIMQELAALIEDPRDAIPLVHMAVSVLQRARLFEHQRAQLVILIERLFKQSHSVMTAEVVGELVDVLSTQLSTMVQREARQAVVSVFMLFGDRTPGWPGHQISKLIADLESWSADAVEERDYDRRLAGMSWLRANQQSLTPASWTPILHILLACLQDPEEVALRNQAAGLLDRFISQADDNQHLCESVLYATIKRHCAHKTEAVRLEMFALLGRLVVRFGDSVGKYASLRPLLAEGKEESNVFTCINHLQVHRRARAIRQIVDFTRSAAISGTNGQYGTSFVEILLPMLMRYCVYNSDAGDAVPAPLVHMEACRVVGWVMGTFMSWGALFRHIRSLVKQVSSPKHPGADKQALKLLPTILEFFDNHRLQVSHEQLTVQLLPVLFEAMKGKSLVAASSTSIHASAIKHPQLAVAVAELLKRLPEECAGLNLPKLYSGLAMTCRSRLEDERREGRVVLVKILTLFPHTFPSLWGELSGTLTRGYQRHVLSHMLSYLLSVDAIESITDDDVIAKCMQCILDDTVGDVAREKGAEEWSGKLREARDCRSFTSLAVLVKKGKSGKALWTVVRMIGGRETRDGKQVERLLETVLVASVGCYTNVDLLMVAHQLVLLDSPHHQVNGATTTNASTIRSLFPLLGLKMISLVVKRDEGKSREQLKSILNALIPTITEQWLGGSQDANIMAAVKLMCLLLVEYGGLPSLEDCALLHKLLQSAFELIVRSSTARQGDLIAAAFKYVALMLRDRPEVPISESQLRALLQYTSEHLERIDSQTLTFSLIRALLSRKVMSADVYTLLKEVRDCSVTSASPPCRQQCLNTFIKFVQEYPMADARKLEHLQFYLDNVEYDGEGGRMSALLGVQAMVGCVGGVLKEDHVVGEAALKRLLLRIANESVESVKRCAEEVGTCVCKSVSQKCIDSVCQSAVKWLGAPKARRCAWIFVRLLVVCDLQQQHKLLPLTLHTLPHIDPSDTSNDNTQLILSALGVLECVETDCEAVLEWMLFPSVPVRLAVNHVLLAWTITSPSHQGAVCENAYKQVTELTDVFGTTLADSAVQLLLKYAADHQEMAVRMERAVKRAGSSQFNTHVGSALKYFAGFISSHDLSPSTDTTVVMMRTCCRINTDQSIRYPEDLKMAAEQVLGLLREKWVRDDDQYNGLHQQVMSGRQAKRTERKVHEKQLAVKDPQAAARRKLRR